MRCDNSKGSVATDDGAVVLGEVIHVDMSFECFKGA
jgi:hypothetical protein